MKFKVVFTILILLIIGAFSYAIYLSLKLERINKKLNETIKKYEEAGLKIEYLEGENAKALVEYAKLINEGNLNKWEIAKGTNTLGAYSLFVENCTGEDEDCREDEIKTAVEKLLSEKGYVQMIETNGNRLYTEVNLSLEGEFVKFNTERSVRNGAIGIADCGASSAARTGGSVLTDRTVKVLDKCEAPGSSSVWGHIQY